MKRGSNWPGDMHLLSELGFDLSLLDSKARVLNRGRAGSNLESPHVPGGPWFRVIFIKVAHR